MKKVVILLLTIGLFSSCKKEENETIVYEDAIEVEANQTESDTIVINTTASEEKEQPRTWSSNETKLPMGTVEKMDCANFYSKDRNIRDNYILIKKETGVSTIKSDINDDLFLCINVGDKIIE